MNPTGGNRAKMYWLETSRYGDILYLGQITDPLVKATVIFIGLFVVAVEGSFTAKILLYLLGGQDEWCYERGRR